MKHLKIYEEFNISKYKGKDLEDLSRKLILHVLNHLGMVRYDEIGIKEYDLTPSEVGNLVDKTVAIYSGVNKHKGVEEFRVRLQEFIDYIASLTDYKVKNSVKYSLNSIISRELKKFKSDLMDYEELWTI